MKKTFITLIVAAFCAIGASAQSYLLNNPDNRSYFGLRAGLDIACPGNVSSQGIGVDAYKNGAGFHVGGIYNIPVVANFYVEPGLNLYYNTYAPADIIKEELDLKSASIRKFGFRIPVMAGYHFDFTPDVKLHVFTGPELEVGCSAKMHVSDGNRSGSGSLYGSSGDLKRINCLWDFGVAVSYQRFQLGFTGAVGMCNMLDNDSDVVTFHENRVSISLGYNF